MAEALKQLVVELVRALYHHHAVTQVYQKEGAMCAACCGCGGQLGEQQVAQ